MARHSDKLLNTKNRIEFFLASFSPLWVIMITSYLIKNYNVTNAIITIIVASILAITISDTVKKFRQLRTSSNPEKMEINEAREITQDYIPYVVSYLFPVLADLTDFSMLFAVIAILIIIGVLYVRTDMLLTNPALLIVGFRLYEVEVQNYHHKLKIISRSPIGRNDSILVREIGHRIYIEQKDRA